MVRDRQKLLGRFVTNTADGHEQEIRVIGDGSRVMFDYPYVKGGAKVYQWGGAIVYHPS